MNFKEIKSAPLYQIVGRITTKKEISIRVFSLTKAKIKGNEWIYPSDTGNKHVSIRMVNILDSREFSINSTLRAYCNKTKLKELFGEIEFRCGKLIVNPEEIKNMSTPVVVETIKPLKTIVQFNKESLATIENACNSDKFVGEDLKDIQAVKSIMAGEINAFAVIYKRYYPVINRMYAKNLQFNDDAADDLTADLFIKVYEKIGEYKPTYTFNSWITKIAKNFFIDYLRKRKLNTISIDRNLTSDNGQQLLNGQGNGIQLSIRDEDSLNGEEIILQNDKTVALNKALLRLDKNSRRLIVMRFIEDKSYEDIAATLNVPEGTVKGNLYRAKKKMKAYLEEHKGLLVCVQG